MYYLLSPLLDAEGKPVVRKPKIGEWIDEGYGPHKMLTDREFPILTLQKFEEDPLADIREIYEIMTQVGEPWETVREMKMFEAIVKTMERVEGK